MNESIRQCKNRSAFKERGFSMVEMLLTISILLIISAMAIIKLSPAEQQHQANAAMIQVASQLRQAREVAITERRDVQVQFVGNNQVVLTRLNLPVGQAVISTVPIQAPATFSLTPGAPDTPDAFGNNWPIEFAGLNGGPPTMMFQSDGTFVDTAGNILNGTVFISILNTPTAARAVTVIGATGRIRMYHGGPSGWIE